MYVLHEIDIRQYTNYDYFDDRNWPCPLLQCSLAFAAVDPEEVVILVVEVHSEGAVDDVAVNLGAEVDLANVPVLEDGLVAVVGGIVCGNVVEATASGETYAPLQALRRANKRVSLLTDDNIYVEVDILYACRAMTQDNILTDHMQQP